MTIPSRNIREAPTLEWAAENVIDPSIAVIFFDDQPDAGKGGNWVGINNQTSNQLWLVVASVKNVSTANAAAKQSVGSLSVEILHALNDFQLSPDHAELIRVRCPFRHTENNGYAHIPFLFSTTITI